MVVARLLVRLLVSESFTDTEANPLMDSAELCWGRSLSLFVLDSGATQSGASQSDMAPHLVATGPVGHWATTSIKQLTYGSTLITKSTESDTMVCLFTPTCRYFYYARGLMNVGHAQAAPTNYCPDSMSTRPDREVSLCSAAVVITGGSHGDRREARQLLCGGAPRYSGEIVSLCAHALCGRSLVAFPPPPSPPSLPKFLPPSFLGG